MELLPNRGKSRIGLTLNWVGSTISISTRGDEKPALICGGNVNHFTIRATEKERERERGSFAYSFFLLFSPTNYSQTLKYEQKLKLKSRPRLNECGKKLLILCVSKLCSPYLP